jgi:hypothetical protein
MSRTRNRVGGTAGVERIRLGGEWSSIIALAGFCGHRRPLLAVIVVLAATAFLLEGIGIGLLIPLVESLVAGDAASGAFGPFTVAM